jgi:hypothetical protein
LSYRQRKKIKQLTNLLKLAKQKNQLTMSMETHSMTKPQHLHQKILPLRQHKLLRLRQHQLLRLRQHQLLRLRQHQNLLEL